MQTGPFAIAASRIRTAAAERNEQIARRQVIEKAELEEAEQMQRKLAVKEREARARVGWYDRETA